MRCRVVFGGSVITLIVLAVLYGPADGFGLGGKGEGSGEGLAAWPRPPTPGPRRCAIRVAASGISVAASA
jgi:hypothetical protein